MNKWILLDGIENGVRTITLRTKTPLKDIQLIEAELKRPYRIKITTSYLTITKFGYKMVSRQCCGGTFIKEVL